MSHWELAQTNKNLLVFSTLFTVRDFDRYFTGDSRVDEAAAWCRDMGVTLVYLETFRGGHQVDRTAITRVRDRFAAAGFDVAGCVTTTGLGKASSGWNVACCFTDPATQDNLQRQFEYAASMFDLIIIDDFFFTDCECPECTREKGERSWPRFRCDLMTELSRSGVLEPARAVNPGVRIILKYPQWYDKYHLRGYDPGRQCSLFEYTFAGTELRDPDRPKDDLPVVPQYQSFYTQRWLASLWPGRCRGGWFDTIRTGPDTYLEQAVQTILGGGHEAFLFTYRSLTGRDHGKADADILRREAPALFRLAAYIEGKPLRGIDAPKPPGSEGEPERYVFDHAGMLGLPLVPRPDLPQEPHAVFLSLHSMAVTNVARAIGKYAVHRIPVLITDGLEKAAGIDAAGAGLHRLTLDGKPWTAADIPQGKLDTLRNAMLAPLGVRLHAPAGVALYLFGDELTGVYNFNSAAAKVRLTVRGTKPAAVVMTVPEAAHVGAVTTDGGIELEMPRRTFVLLA